MCAFGGAMDSNNKTRQQFDQIVETYQSLSLQKKHEFLSIFLTGLPAPESSLNTQPDQLTVEDPQCGLPPE